MDGAFRLVVVMTLVLAVVVGLGVVRGAVRPAATAEPSPTAVTPASYLYPDPRPAPALALVDQDGEAFSAGRFTGGASLVFFGYTHCPDVCPTTIGTLTEVAARYGSGVRVVFVSVDPERDTVEWLADYVRYLPVGFSALTGSPAQVRAAADGWGVRYAKVETGTPGEYSMSHTAEVFLVDGGGMLRAHFPFGTGADAVVATLLLVAGATPPPATPIATPAGATPPPAPTADVEALTVEVVSSSIWAGGSTPVILALSGPDGRIDDLEATVSVRVTAADGGMLGSPGAPVTATAVRPPGVPEVSYVAVVDLPSPGAWGLAVEVVSGGIALAGRTSVAALDPGATARLGGRAPDVRTPTLDDVGGVALRVTTDPLPNLDFSRTSTVDALAENEPFVFVVDSIRFKVTPACGKALTLAKYLSYRWPDLTFIHLEPYAYDVVTDAPVLRGSLEAPELVAAADAWGFGSAPWGVGSMPWVFIVDAGGTVVAKYQGVVGSDDIDVVVSMLAAGR
ncbi:MAG: SCO family protein [Chloroflexota bacterium]